MPIILIELCISSLWRRGPGRRRRRRRRRFHPLPQRHRQRRLANPSNRQASASALFRQNKIRTMEFSITLAGVLTTIMGVASFLIGIASELNRMPPSGMKKLKDGKIKCIYPDDNSSYYGYISLIFIVISAIIGSLHKYHSAAGVKAPLSAYAHNSTLKAFFFCAMFMEGLAFYMVFQPLYVLHQLRNQSYDHPIDECPTPDSGVVAGGALSSFGACALWIIVFILAKNCREDFLRGSDGNSSVGSYGLIDDEIEGAW